MKIKNEEILTIKATIEKKKFGLGVTFFYILCIDCTNFSVLFLFLFRPLDSIFSQNLPLNEKNKNCGLKSLTCAHRLKNPKTMYLSMAWLPNKDSITL